MDEPQQRFEPPESVEQLKQEIIALRAAVRARDDFISVAAHELRNPLTPLMAQADLLRQYVGGADGTLPERVVLGVERLDRIVRRYIARTTTLLDISRLTSTCFTPDLTVVDVSALVSDLTDDFALHAEVAGSTISAAIEDGVSALLDRTALEQIVENLISNAVRYGNGTPIDVMLHRGHQEIVLRVRDRGVGISEQDQARIFGRFEQLMKRRSSGGFGLGLWVVGQLTAALDGSIAVDSRPGEGSTFTVRLPLKPTENTP